MREIPISEVQSLVGQEIGVSDWLEITQDRVNRFADATGDHQWIHVDVERAKKGPFGGPIAHGFLTLSLLPPNRPLIESMIPMLKLPVARGRDSPDVGTLVPSADRFVTNGASRCAKPR